MPNEYLLKTLDHHPHYSKELTCGIRTMTRSRLDSCERVLYTALKLAFDILLLDLHAVAVSFCLSWASLCERKAEVKSLWLMRITVWQCFLSSCQPILHISILLQGWVWRSWKFNSPTCNQRHKLLPLELFNCHLKTYCWKCAKWQLKCKLKGSARLSAKNEIYIRFDLYKTLLEIQISLKQIISFPQGWQVLFGYF